MNYDTFRRRLRARLEEKLEDLYRWRRINPCIRLPVLLEGESCCCYSDRVRSECEVIEYLESELAFFDLDVFLPSDTYELLLGYDPNVRDRTRLAMIRRTQVASHMLRTDVIYRELNML